MALPKLEKDIAYISKLDNEPNDVGGLSAGELKSRFDAAGQDIQEYINEELIPRIESDIEAAALGVGAGGAIDGNTISDGSVTTSKLADKAVTTAKLADSGITTAKLADKAVTEDKLAEDSVTDSAIKDGSVITNKLANGAVTADKIFAGAVGNAKIAANAVSSAKIADKAVTRAKLADNAVSQTFTGTLLANGWTGTTWGAYQQLVFTGSGILAHSAANVDTQSVEVGVDTGAFQMSENPAAIAAVEAWADIFRAIPVNNGVQFNFRAAPAIDIPVYARVVYK